MFSKRNFLSKNVRIKLHFMKKFAIIYLNEIKIAKIDILRKQNE